MKLFKQKLWLILAMLVGMSTIVYSVESSFLHSAFQSVKSAGAMHCLLGGAIAISSLAIIYQQQRTHYQDQMYDRIFQGPFKKASSGKERAILPVLIGCIGYLCASSTYHAKHSMFTYISEAFVASTFSFLAFSWKFHNDIEDKELHNRVNDHLIQNAIDTNNYDAVREILETRHDINRRIDSWIRDIVVSYLKMSLVYRQQNQANVCRFLRLFLQYNAKITIENMIDAVKTGNQEIAEILIKGYIVQLAKGYKNCDQYKNSSAGQKTHSAGESGLNALPPEVYNKIVRKLPMSDIGSLVQVNQRSRQCIYTNCYDEEALDYFSRKLIELLDMSDLVGESPLSIMESNVGIGFSDLADQLKSDVKRKEYIQKVLQEREQNPTA